MYNLNQFITLGMVFNFYPMYMQNIMQCVIEKADVNKYFIKMNFIVWFFHSICVCNMCFNSSSKSFQINDIKGLDLTCYLTAIILLRL